MACSKEIPLARFLYHLYGYNRTRVQPRHLVEFSLAVSVLAGLGIKALADTSALKRLQAVRRATTTAAVGLLLALLAFIYSGGNLNKQLAHLNVSNVPLLPWRNPAISIPLLVMLAGSLVLYYWSRRHTKFSAALLVLVLSLDLGSFGWLCEWRYRVSKPEDLQVPDVLTSYKQRLVNSGQRLLSMTPSFGPAETAPANLSRLWGIPNARGYNPLILSRYSELLDQSVPAYQVFSDNNRSLDILSVVYVLVPKPFLGDGNNSAADHVNRDGDVPRYLQNPRRWHHVDDFLHTAVSENGHAMPRAWLVPKTIPLQPHQILRAIQESTLPDGRAYDPSQVALVEEPFVFDVENPDSHAAAKVAQLSDTRIEVHTECGTPAFLVLSDVYYPGWRATINGEPAHIFQTNYVLRGVKVPAGYNVVCFEFRPLSFYSGVAVSSCSLLLTMAILAGIIHEHSPQRRRERRGNAENRAEA
jgi:multisubunit Na+/H+ antiporter MnhB subunit